MKKSLILSAVITFISLGKLQAQWTLSSNSLFPTAYTTNNVGIGTNVPGERLNVHNGNISLTNSTDANERSIKGNTSAGSFKIYANNAYNNGAYIEMFGNTNTAGYGKMNFVHNSNTSSSFEFWKFSPSPSPTFTSQFVIKNDGAVGIGDQNPTATLTLNGGFDFTTSTLTRKFRAHTTANLEIYSNTTLDDGSALFVNSNSSIYDPGAVTVLSNGSQGDINSFAVTNHTTPNGWLSCFRVLKNGKVIIGDVPFTFASSNNYKLFVKDGIITERVKVALSTDPANWADYVFNDDYELKSLEYVEEYIESNHHLPEIPSTEEVHTNGLDLAQMDAKLLQKVEELTLYLIDQNKTIKAQNERIESLEKQLKNIK